MGATRVLGTRARRRATNTTKAYSPVDALHAEELYAQALGRQARLTRSFFEAASQELVEHQARRRRQPAGRNFAREGSEKPYEEFLECLLFYYREDARAAERRS